MSNKTLVQCSALAVSRLSSRFTPCIRQPPDNLCECLGCQLGLAGQQTLARSAHLIFFLQVDASSACMQRASSVAVHKQAICAHLRECTFMNVRDTTVLVLTSHMHKYIPRCAGALERYSLALIARALLHPIVWVLVLLNATVKRSSTELSYIPLGKRRVPLSQRWWVPLSQSRARLRKFGGQP